MKRPMRAAERLTATPADQLDPTEVAARLNLRRLPGDLKSKNVQMLMADSGQLAELSEYLDEAGVLPCLERRFRPRRGRTSKLPMRSFWVLALYLAGPMNNYLRTNFAALIPALHPQDAVDLGLQSVEGLREPPSYNAICKRGTRIEQGVSDGWIDEDGTVCDSKWLIKTMIGASVPDDVKWRTKSVAVDPTDFPSAARQVLANARAKTVTEADIPELNKPKRPRLGAKRRNFTRTTGLIGQKRPDGTTILSKTPGAGSGYRSASSSHKEGPFFGNYLTIAVATKSRRVTRSRKRIKFEHDVDGYICSMDMSPAGSNAAAIARNAVNEALDLCPNINDVLVDRGISQARADFNRSMHKIGVHVTMDHKGPHLVSAKPVKLGPSGYPAWLHAGTLLHAYTPKKRRAPAEGLDEEQLEAFYADRAPFELAVNQHFANGDKQFVSPTHTGSLYIDPTRQTAPPTQALRPKPSDFDKRFKSLPAETLLQPFINVSVSELDDFQQPAYGTRAQKFSYGRRLQSENAIAQVKNENGLTNKTVRVLNDGARLIAAIARVAWHNLKITRDRKQKAQEEKQARRAATATRIFAYVPTRFLAPEPTAQDHDNDDPDAAASRAPP